MTSLQYTGRGSDNPYRTGVLIGNYVEDMFGLDLKEKYGRLSKSISSKRNLAISENTDMYRWPTYSKGELYSPGNELTLPCSSNFDLNIDFNRKNVEDFMTLSKSNEYVLDNKNSFLRDEVLTDNFRKRGEEESKCIISQPSVFSETQKALKDLHIQDTDGVLFSRQSGLKSNLLFGHGCQKKFDKNDLASVYHLSHSKNIPTNTFLDPHWTVHTPYHHPPPPDRDYMDWGYRKYKEYGKFTKKFDKKKKK